MNKTKVKVNELCLCGSGKKYKKCCRDKLPRHNCVYIAHEEKFKEVIRESGEIFIRLFSGEKVKPNVVLSQVEYERKSGKSKALNCIYDKATLNIPEYLFKTFNMIFAIDTNTKQIEKDNVSIATIFECYVVGRVMKDGQLQGVNCQCRINGILAFKNCPTEEAEKFSWFKLINILTSSRMYNANLKIAIITDHDLGNHLKYNNQEIPIFKDFYLPENFKLIYASSDAGKENIMNKFLAECDKCSAGILKELKANRQAVVNKKVILLDNISDITHTELSHLYKK